MIDENSSSSQLPIGWERVNLKDIADFKNGINFASNQRGLDGIITIDVLNMYTDTLFAKTDNLYRVNIQPKSDYILKNGDILFVRSSVKREGVGWASLYKEITEPVTFCGFIIRARLRYDWILPKFLIFFLRLGTTRNKIIGDSSQVVITNINQESLGKVIVPIPPVSEQRRIVGKVEELFSFLDAGVSSLLAVQKQLKRYRLAVLKAAFEGKLTEQWRKAHPERIEYTSGLHSKITKIEFENSESPKRNRHSLEGFPESWEIAQLGELLAETLLGLVFSISQQNKQKNGVPYIKMNNITIDGKLDLSNIVYVKASREEILKYQLNNGDILFNTRNSFELVGKTTVAKDLPAAMIFNNNIMRIRVCNGINPYFVAYQMNSPLFRNLLMREKKATTNICAIYSKNLLPLSIVIPSTEEQGKIVEEIDRHFSLIDNVEKTVLLELRQTKNLRNNILKEAFEGRLVPQNPSDESAEKLLERINNERLTIKLKSSNQAELSKYVK